MSRTYHLLVPNVIPIFCAIGLMVCPADAGKVGEWRSYGSDNSSTKFLPLDQINKGNVKDLPPLGWGQRNFPLLTQTLLFTAAQAQWDVTGNSPRGNAIEVTFDDQNPFLWAFDPDNGQLISRTNSRAMHREHQ